MLAFEALKDVCQIRTVYTNLTQYPHSAVIGFLFEVSGIGGLKEYAGQKRRHLRDLCRIAGYERQRGGDQRRLIDRLKAMPTVDLRDLVRKDSDNLVVVFP
jgi:hypothetical protein